MKTTLLIRRVCRVALLPAVVLFCSLLQSYDQTPGVVLNGSGGLLTEERQVADFTAVSVSSGINLQIRRGDKISVKVQTNRNIVPYIETRVERGTIYVRLKARTIINRSRDLNVYITMPVVSELVASGSSEIVLKDRFDTPGMVYIRAGVASKITGEIACDRMEVNTNSGSEVSLEGKVRDVCTVKCSSGSYFYSYGLVTNNLNLTATSGSEIHATADGSISINATSSSKISYRGRGKVVGMNAAGNAKVKRG